MGISDKARTAADIAKVLMHAEPKKGQMGPVAQSLEALWAYLTNKARLIDRKALHELRGESGPYKVEYMGNRRTPKNERMIGITCHKVLFDDLLSEMRGRGVHEDHTKSKGLVVVSVQKIVEKS